MKHVIVSFKMEIDPEDNFKAKFVHTDSVTVESKFALGNDPVFLALVTATASKMMEKQDKVQIIACESLPYGDVDTVLYEMIRT